MNYKQTEEYLYSQLPVFHRQGASAYKANLDSTIALMTALSHPEDKFRSIHVAGTNGKGSSSHLLASIMYEYGLKTGLHTSPHLKDLTERIVINGKQASKNYVIQFVKRNQKILESIAPSFFEMMVAMAFNYFAGKTDIAVIEVGMGGRLDSTNVITPQVCLITNISFDHTQFLGDTLEKIAAEKAGIIKKGVPVVISQTQKETKPVFMAKAKEQGCKIYFADENFAIRNLKEQSGMLVMDIYQNGKLYIKNLQCPLTGDYQKKNILGVIQTVEALNQTGKYHISKQNIADGIKNVMNNFPLWGRWQTLSTNPLTVCDTGHNEDGLRYVMEQLQRTRKKNLHFVIGVVNDKDIDTEIRMLPKDAVFYLCKADIPRGLDVETLSGKFKAAGLKFKAFGSVKDALKQAQKDALADEGMVFVGGSTYTVAEIV
ncbi:MAG: bifunctional folylpolyglutamate synthase/dihydrofolate synthase [Bacteroidales bacterium]|nr:bifunctional folylpolyglutamate synthase/dihydrofolate synthase [Bacteroidales bacterium]